MADAKKYLDLAGLVLYDEKIKEYLAAADETVNARSIKTVLVDGDVIKFYKKEGATTADTPDYTVAISSSDVEALKEILEGYSGKGSVKAAVDAAQAAADAAQADVDTLETTVGDMTAVKTTAKTVAGAVDELKDALDAETTASKVTLEVAGTPTEGYLKTYVIGQGGSEVGKIDIPKELVVTAGEVIHVDAEHPVEGLEDGTYIKLTIANQENPIYINVKDLVDVYTAAAGATQVQLAISDTNEISATLVAGSVGTTELADAAITTDKITDGAVTKAKLDAEVQASIDKADSAIQESDLTAAIEALDATVTQDGSAENGTGLTLTVVETDGKLASISGSINTIPDADITSLF